MNTLFTLSQFWKSYDVFGRQKISTLRSSRPAVLELAARYKDVVLHLEQNPRPENDEAEKLLFKEMCEICLWGNATDLSLLTSLTYEDIQELQGSEARKSLENNIVVNDLESAYRALKAKTLKRQDRVVDIVLDNAGFELYVDLCLAGYLLSAGLATNVVLHCKSIPWFVSDVIPADFATLLSALADPKFFFSTPEETYGGKIPTPLSEAELNDLLFLFKQWSERHQEGQLTLRENRFWTEGGSFWLLPTSAPQLFEDLKDSDLVIFKGDLNYRKLTADVSVTNIKFFTYANKLQAMWDPKTPFSEAIGPLGPESGMNVLTLRTCKSDVVVGLKPGEDEKLRATEGGGGDSGQRKWAWSGKWATISFSAGH